MSKTLRVVNGQLDISASTGQLITLSGERKCAQDMANCMLQEFLAEQQYGSYLKAVVENRIPFATEMLIRFYVADAINRLSALQEADPEITEDEKINQIAELLTTPDDAGTVGFYVRVTTQSGTNAEAGVLGPTQLNHLTEGF